MFVDIKLFLYRPIVPKLLCLVLALVLFGQITAGVLSFFSLNAVVPTHAEKQVEAKNMGGQAAIKKGLSTAFFGDYIPKNLDDSDIKQSMLNLQVVGIMYAESEGTSHVIIRTAAGREQSFHVGDSLPGGVIIKRITPYAVVVVHQGTLESLSLPKNELLFEVPAKPLKLKAK